MKFVVLFVLLAVLPSHLVSSLLFDIEKLINNLEGHWKTYKKHHNHKFSKNDDDKHFSTFKKNAFMIREHNQKESTYKLGTNQFLHMDPAMFKVYRGTHMKHMKTKPAIAEVPASMSKDDVDWREKGGVTPVKDQGQCGSCWAFSAVGALESQLLIYNKKNISLSEQNLVDCAQKYGCEGCNGGFYTGAWEYTNVNGINDNKSYPYVAKTKECKPTQKKLFLKNNLEYKMLPQGDEESLSEFIRKHGPISVAIDASHPSFQFYHSGIYYESNCSSSDLDHAVLAVGVGSKPNDYFVIKNSWSNKWGEDGYMKMARNKNNHCGIASAAASVTIKKSTNIDEL